MHPVILKTFGGLSKAYYFRQIFFGLIIGAFAWWMLSKGQQPPSFLAYVWIAASTLLYPYSRFVYESVVDFITGGNIFFVNAILLLVVKLFTMLICWYLGLIIAPVGLLYLYYHHSKAQ